MKKVIITGASDGLGLEVGKLLADKGASIVCLSRGAPSDTRFVHLAVDLSSERGIEEVSSIIKSDHSDFDALINCAAVFSTEPLEKLSYSEVEKLLKVNVTAPMILISQLANLIKRNGADIVNVGSTISYKAYKDQASYGVSKWALRGFNENLRLELKDTRCRVIGFMPGGFQSNFIKKFTNKEVDMSPFMKASDLAQMLVHVLEMPKLIEVSEIILNRKSLG